MKKFKIISSVIAFGSITTPSVLFLTSCNETKDSTTLGKDGVVIVNNTVTGINPSSDLSKYDTLSIPEGVKKIARNAFKDVFGAGKSRYGVNNNIKTIVLPSTIETIESGAFAGGTAIETLDLSNLSAEKLLNISFGSKSDLNIFSEWKTKGTIKLSKSAQDRKSDVNTVLLNAGIPTFWIFDGGDSHISETHLLSINDFHGAAPGFGDDFFDKDSYHQPGAIRLANDMQRIINKYPGSVLVSAGDYNAGDAFSTCTHGETFYPVLKQMDIRYSAVGNHGWEWGKEPLEQKTFDNWARTEDTVGNYFVASNILAGAEFRQERSWNPFSDSQYHLWNENRVKWADPYKVINMNGHDICLIGITTHDTMVDGNQHALANTTILDSNNYISAVAYAQRLAKEELGDDYNKIESFILLTHCASDYVNGQISGEAALLAKEASNAINFDAIISAHSHKTVCGVVHNNNLDKDIWVGQAANKGLRFLDTTLKFDDSKKPGQRLESISMSVKKPYIAGEALVEGEENDWNKAHNEIDEIVNDTIYPVVRNTAKEYYKQKEIAVASLNSPVGSLAYEGLPYVYNRNIELGHSFLQSDTHVEPLGVWTTLSHQQVFNYDFAKEIQGKEIWPVSIALNNADSFHADFLTSESTSVTKNQIYQLHPYENNSVYGCLTLYQLRQYINYILDGGDDIFNYSSKPEYVDHTTRVPKKFYYEDLPTPEQEGNVIEWTDDELVSKDGYPDVKVKGLSASCACVQFFGMSFHVKPWAKGMSQGKEVTIYQLDEDEANGKPLRIYSPWDSTNKLEDPTTWTVASQFANNEMTHGYVPIVMSNFTWIGGNAQNRMLHHWMEYNHEKMVQQYTQIAVRSADLLTRNATLRYAEYLTKGDAAFVSEPKPLDYMVNYDYCKKQIIRHD